MQFAGGGKLSANDFQYASKHEEQSHVHTHIRLCGNTLPWRIFHNMNSKFIMTAASKQHCQAHSPVDINVQYACSIQ